MQTYYKSMDELPAMLSVMDIKKLFDIGKKQAYELVHTEGFPAVKIGASIKIPKHMLIKWLEDSVKKGVGPEC